MDLKGPSGERPLDGNELRNRISENFLGGAMKDRPLAHVAEIAKSESSLFDVQSFILNIFEPLQPADFHSLIAAFRWHAILSTNYDFVLERAYQNADSPLQTLGKIIRDGDRVGEVISSLQKVPFLKLHGCLSVINDQELPLILATEEYAKHRRNRTRLFNHFQDWSREYPVIFCGYDLSDPNIQQILYDVGDRSVNRSMFVMVRPNISDLDKRYWSSRRVVPISSTFEEFLRGLDVDLPPPKRVLSVLVQTDAPTIQRWVSRGTPSDILRVYLDKEIDHVRADIPTVGVIPEDFYRGIDDDWDAFRQKFDVPRRISDDLLIEAVLDGLTDPITNVFMVKGHAGSGKSITLRRAAWDAATEHKALVLWLRDGGLVRSDLIRELCELTDDRVFLFVEDALQHLKELNNLVAEGKQAQLRLTIIMGARTNEWNVAGDQFQGNIDSEYELRDLSDREITDLLANLERTDCMGSLRNIDKDARSQHFVLSSERQLLVALHEATSGKPFEEIVLDEYRNLVPLEAQTLYKDVCTLHRFNVGVRAGLLSRISGVTFSHFETQLLKPLEHVVTVYLDGASRDYAYRTRHPLVADWVFRQVFENQDDRADQLVRIIGAMNTDYESDSKAFEELIRGRDLAELFSDRILADRIFEAAGRSGASRAHVEHQRAVFELHHPSGNTDRALRALEASQKESEYPNQSVLHTKALVLRKKAMESESTLARQKYRSDAKKILERQVRKGHRPHSFHSLGQILLDEFDDELKREGESDGVSALKERVLADQLSSIEKVIKAGTQHFPGDSYLLSLEAKLAELLEDNPRALRALTKANERNPQNEHVAIRLSKMLSNLDDTTASKRVLQNCLETNPVAKLARLEVATALIREDEGGNREEIRRLLRSAFTDGDTNYETQFWYARHQYLFGDKANSEKLFKELSGARIPPTYKNRARGHLNNSAGEPRRFDGEVTNVRDTYCFVNVPALHSDAFVHHSECAETDWTTIHAGSRVTISIAFSFKGAQGVDMSLRTDT